MERQVFRAEANFGATKSHVPDSSFRRAIEESDQVLGERIQADITEDEKALRLMADTIIKAAQMRSPTVLRQLRDAGFGDEEFGTLTTLTPGRMQCGIKVRERSVRYRSHSSRRQDLAEASVAGLLDPHAVRRIMAGDLDSAFSGDDDEMLRAARRATLRIIAGEEWQPRAMGEYGDWFLREFQKAQVNRAVLKDPEAMGRLDRAVKGQMQVNMQETVMRDPQLFAQAQAQAAAEPAEEEAIEPQSPAEALDRLLAGGAQ